MDDPKPNLGLSFFADRLFYSVNNPSKESGLSIIGSFDFNFNVLEAISTMHPEHYPQFQNTIDSLISEYEVNSIRALTSPIEECWTVLPKVVYDNSDEREDHLSIIMKGVSREDIEPTWHALSKPRFKFLCLRRISVMSGLHHLGKKVTTTEFLSDFELAAKWSAINTPGGSFMMIGCHENVISVSSFMLGKFRAATFIKFDLPDDLPYHWLQQAAHSTWMKGLHEKTYFFGFENHRIKQFLAPYLDKSTEVITLNSLNEMNVIADETTYGFDLAEAFPAILLSLEN